MPGLFETKQTTEKTIPGWFENALFPGISGARDLLNQGAFQGPYASPTNPYQTGGVQAGAGAGQTMGQIGGQLTGGLGSAFDYYQNTLGGQASPWMQNPEAYLGLAGQVADTPYLQGQIDAALRDPFRQLTEQTLPGIQQGFMGDNAGSSREAIMSGLAQRGYADRASDVGAQMRGAAYNQGLGIADRAAQGDLSSWTNAANQLGNLGGQGLGYLAGGANQLFNAGQQQFGLDEIQRQAQERQFYEPWRVLQNYNQQIQPLYPNAVGQNVSTDNGLWNGLLGLGLGGLGAANQAGILGPLWQGIGGLFGGGGSGVVGSAGTGTGSQPSYDPYGTGAGYDPFGLFGGGLG